MGFCSQCRSDGALVEVAARTPRAGARRSTVRAVSIVEAGNGDGLRRSVGIPEFDRALGGGLVAGSAVLVGGEPGVGKSTLLLQVAGATAGAGAPVMVASAEESLDQIALRARRLGVKDPEILVVARTDVDDIIDVATEAEPALLIVDSIQTVGAPEVGGAPGGIAQVRETTARLIHFAKTSGTPVVLVGHVTKDGSIAGPKLVEHAVDVVLYLEGDAERGLRVLRCLKNRFGPTHDAGLFEMSDRGLLEVPDPSDLLVSEGAGSVPGSVMFPAVDGRRSLLIEVQALVAKTSAPQPRRSVKGLDTARVHQVVAVLERHVGLSFSGMDIYVSVVGGVRLRDPGSDLPVAIALASSLLARSVGKVAAWGEVGLTGEVRSVSHGDGRRSEAKRLGSPSIVAPGGAGSDMRLVDALAGLGLASGEPDPEDDELSSRRNRPH